MSYARPGQCVFRIAAICITVFAAFAIKGCGDFFDTKTTEMETRRTLEDLRRIQPLPEIHNPLPEIYRKPPSRMEIDGSVRLFYFTRQHNTDAISSLITQQLGHKVTNSEATNQLIIEVPDHSAADDTLDFLEKVDIAPIQIKIDCLVLERFADVTMDWETRLFIEDFLGTNIEMRGKGEDFMAFPGAALREGERRRFGVDLGFVRDHVEDEEFRAFIDVLISRGYLKVLMNPTLETVHGKRATVRSRTNTPVPKRVEDPIREQLYTLTEYQWVEDKLEVTPFVYSDGSIGLETNIELGSASQPEGVVQVPVITERSVRMAENRIAPGDSLIVGGIRKSEEFSVVRGVPFLKDIPGLGILFSSRDFEEKSTEVIFILTPAISSGGIPYEQMVEEVRDRFRPAHEAPGLHERLFDPLGLGTYTRTVEEEAAQAEYERLKADLERAEAHEELAELRETLLQQAEQVMREKQQVARTRQELQQLHERYETAQAESEQTQAQLEQAQQEAEAARREAEEARREAEELQSERELSEQEKLEVQQQLEQAEEEAARARQEVEALEADASQAAQRVQELTERAEQAEEVNDAELEEIRRKAEQAEAELREAREELAQAESEIEAEQSEEGQQDD